VERKSLLSVQTMSFDALVSEKSKFQNFIFKSKRFLSSAPFFIFATYHQRFSCFPFSCRYSSPSLFLFLHCFVLSRAHRAILLRSSSWVPSCGGTLSGLSGGDFRSFLSMPGESRFSSSRYQINRGIPAGETRTGLNGNNSKVKPVARLRKPLSEKQHSEKTHRGILGKDGNAPGSRKI